MRRAARRAQRVRLVPDPSRVVAQLFVPGHALAGQAATRGRPASSSDVLELDDAEVDRSSLDVAASASADATATCTGTFRRHADRIADRLDPAAPSCPMARRLLLGATFTHEYSVEAAALCNPSVGPGTRPVGARRRRRCAS